MPPLPSHKMISLDESDLSDNDDQEDGSSTVTLAADMQSSSSRHLRHRPLLKLLNDDDQIDRNNSSRELATSSKLSYCENSSIFLVPRVESGANEQDNPTASRDYETAMSTISVSPSIISDLSETFSNDTSAYERLESSGISEDRWSYISDNSNHAKM